MNSLANIKIKVNIVSDTAFSPLGIHPEMCSCLYTNVGVRTNSTVQHSKGLEMSFNPSTGSQWTIILLLKNEAKTKENKNPPRHRQQQGDCQRESEAGETEEGMGLGGGRGGINGDGQRLHLGCWTHNTVYRWCTLKLYTWKLYNY